LQPSLSLAVRGALCSALASSLTLLSITSSGATNWPVAATPASKSAQALSMTAPPATTTLTAACLSSSAETAVITWSPVAHATSYQVYQATSANGTYSASPTQPSGAVTAVNITYTTNTSLYYKLYAIVGTNWKGALSAGATVSGVTAGFLAFSTSNPRCTNN
jgi:hypothetical protein